MTLPEPKPASMLNGSRRRLLITATGFEDRSLGWTNRQLDGKRPLTKALVYRYLHPKGENRESDLLSNIHRLGVESPSFLEYDTLAPQRVELPTIELLASLVREVDEIVVDISAMTKLLELIVLSALVTTQNCVRVAYSEAVDYAPTLAEYELSRRGDISLIARFPSRGVESIVRAKSLSSIRMQGQPVCLIAFASFNEQLIRHMLGTITPHRLIIINGLPPRKDYKWRAKATQEIHSQLIDEYPRDNPIDANGALMNTVSSMDYRETVTLLESIYSRVGAYERVICAATGSKMQTLGLFIAKALHRDLHIEYPTPDSYYFEKTEGRGLSTGVKEVYEVVFESFRRELTHLEQFQSSWRQELIDISKGADGLATRH